MKTQLTILAASVLCLCGITGCESNGDEVVEDRMEDQADRLEDRADDLEDAADDVADD